MVSSERQDVVITNEDAYDAFEDGRQLMHGCEIRPESLSDRPEERTEWHRGNVAQTLFCQASSGTPEERAVKTWQCLVNLDR